MHEVMDSLFSCDNEINFTWSIVKSSPDLPKYKLFAAYQTSHTNNLEGRRAFLGHVLSFVQEIKQRVRSQH
jgi:hypothetical protein